MWHIYTIEYYLADKNNNARKFESKWMKLEKHHPEGGNLD